MNGCCKDYVENIKIIDGAFLMAWVHGAKKGYTGKLFVYCPWCSLKLIYVAQHGLRHKPYTIQVFRTLAVTLSTGRLRRKEQG